MFPLLRNLPFASCNYERPSDYLLNFVLLMRFNINEGPIMLVSCH